MRRIDKEICENLSDLAKASELNTDSIANVSNRLSQAEQTIARLCLEVAVLRNEPLPSPTMKGWACEQLAKPWKLMTWEERQDALDRMNRSDW